MRIVPGQIRRWQISNFDHFPKAGELNLQLATLLQLISFHLGQIKIDFSHYKRADVVIVDKEAYLYGKFYEVGTLDIEMYYKLQHGCLTVTLHSANILPSHEDPGKLSN